MQWYPGRALGILVLVLPGVLIQIRGVLGDVSVEHYNLARHVPLLYYELVLVCRPACDWRRCRARRQVVLAELHMKPERTG